jgi:hypothetical protein
VRKLGATVAVVCVAVLAGASHRAQSTAVETGVVNLTDKTWICKGPVDLKSVTVTFDQAVPQTSATPGAHDAVHLGSGCSGEIGTLTVVQYHGDGVKVGGGAHDLTIDRGSIRCFAHDVGKHQDGIQAMGGKNVRFNQMDVQCDSSNNAALFINRGTQSPELPTGIVCDGCFLQGGGITVRIGNSVSSGVVDSVVVPGHIAAVRIYAAGAVDPVDSNNAVGVAGAGLPTVAPLAITRVGARPGALVQARVLGAQVRLSASVSVTRAATIVVGVAPVSGRPMIPMLKGSFVGTARTQIMHYRIVDHAHAGAPIRIDLRVPARAVRPGVHYRVTVDASDGSESHKQITLPFLR